MIRHGIVLIACIVTYRNHCIESWLLTGGVFLGMCAEHLLSRMEKK
jgi:hypothetical protein